MGWYIQSAMDPGRTRCINLFYFINYNNLLRTKGSVKGVS